MNSEARMSYASAHVDQYLDWIGNVERGPYSALDRIEFALISAHTPMEPAIRGWMATRDADTLTEVSRGLDSNSVLSPYVKAGRIMEVRHLLEDGVVPWPAADYQTWREEWKLPGLGYCKASFACCLVDPFGANVLCLDTHMVQAVMVEPTKADMARLYRKPKEYVATEALLLAEASEVGLPAFAYQWAAWDYQRAIRHGRIPESHSFLWDTTNVRYQMPLFSSMEVE